MGTGEEQQQQQEGGFQREVDAAEKSLAVVMVAVRRRFKLFFFVTPQCETFKESGCEGTRNHLDGPKSQKCSGPLL